VSEVYVCTDPEDMFAGLVLVEVARRPVPVTE
jgi:hypothetical protein